MQKSLLVIPLALHSWINPVHICARYSSRTANTSAIWLHPFAIFSNSLPSAIRVLGYHLISVQLTIGMRLLSAYVRKGCIQLSVISLCGIQSSILDRRAHGEVISLVVTNPRITEWLYAGNLSPDSSQIPSAKSTVCKSVTCEILPLDGGHFITGYRL